MRVKYEIESTDSKLLIVLIRTWSVQKKEKKEKGKKVCWLFSMSKGCSKTYLFDTSEQQDIAGYAP